MKNQTPPPSPDNLCQHTPCPYCLEKRDSLLPRLRQLEAQNRRYREILGEVVKKQPEVLSMIRKNKFVFEDKGGRWEKLAFTLYTDICELHSHARAALEEGKGD